MATRLLDTLQRRHPSVANALLDAMTIDARATVDRTFEAMLLLFFNHQIWVEPCRRLLDCQHDAPAQFLLTRPGGAVEIIGHGKLMMMAGLDA